MDFHPSDSQAAVRDAVAAFCRKFGDDHWLERDRDDAFCQAFADAGWLGICIPEAHGGLGLGVAEASVMMRTNHGIGRGYLRRVLPPHKYLRPRPAVRPRYRRAEKPRASRDDLRKGQGLML